jgi:hypothetical protein
VADAERDQPDPSGHRRPPAARPGSDVDARLHGRTGAFGLVVGSALVGATVVQPNRIGAADRLPDAIELDRADRLTDRLAVGRDLSGTVLSRAGRARGP